MIRTVPVFLGMLLLGLGAGSPVAAQSAAVIEKGKAVYAEQKCDTCHSIAGEGNRRGPLDDVGDRLSVEDIRLWMVDARTMTARTKSTRRPFMPSYPKLSKEELDAVVAYMKSLKKTP